MQVWIDREMPDVVTDEAATEDHGTFEPQDDQAVQPAETLRLQIEQHPRQQAMGGKRSA